MNSLVYQWGMTSRWDKGGCWAPQFFSCPLSLSDNIKGYGADTFCKRFEMIIIEFWFKEEPKRQKLL